MWMLFRSVAEMEILALQRPFNVFASTLSYTTISFRSFVRFLHYSSMLRGWAQVKKNNKYTHNRIINFPLALSFEYQLSTISCQHTLTLENTGTIRRRRWGWMDVVLCQMHKALCTRPILEYWKPPILAFTSERRFCIQNFHKSNFQFAFRRKKATKNFSRSCFSSAH